MTKIRMSWCRETYFSYLCEMAVNLGGRDSSGKSHSGICEDFNRACWGTHGRYVTEGLEDG